MKSTMRILMAKSPPMDQSIHQGVHHLPTKQKSDSLIANTPFQNPGSRKHTPIYANCDGSNHEAPKELRL